MIFYLVRRNLPEPLALFFAAFAAYSLYVVPAIAPVVGVPFFLMLWAAQPQRGSTFEGTLPIRGRDIVAARVLSHFALMTLPLAAWMYASFIRPPPALPMSRVVSAPLLVLLALVLPYAIEPSELYEVAFLKVVAMWIAMAAVCGAAFWLLPPDVAFEALLISVVVAGYSIWLRIPDGLQVWPTKLVRAKSPRTKRLASEPTHALLRRAWRPYVHSILEGGPGVWLYALMIAAFAIVLGGLGRGAVQPYMLFYLLIPMARVRQDTRWLAAFPLSNRARLWAVLLPAVLLPLGLFALGRATSPLFGQQYDPMTEYAPDELGSYKSTRVPLEFWRAVTPGVEPLITAPWGESITADTISILGRAVYNPYSTMPSSTSRFVEWQNLRATTAVFGVPIGSEKYAMLMRSRTLPPDLLSSTTMDILNGAVVLTLALLFALANECTRWYQIRVRGRRWTIGGYFLLYSLLAAMMFEVFYRQRGVRDMLTPLAEKALLRLSAILPSSLVVVSLLAAIPVVIVYALLERQFAKAEIIEPAMRGSRLFGRLTRPVPYFHTS